MEKKRTWRKPVVIATLILGLALVAWQVRAAREGWAYQQAWPTHSDGMIARIHMGLAVAAGGVALGLAALIWPWRAKKQPTRVGKRRVR
jgi:uncharacterized membrane protein YcjF (UPF0283 family)